MCAQKGLALTMRNFSEMFYAHGERWSFHTTKTLTGHRSVPFEHPSVIRELRRASASAAAGSSMPLMLFALWNSGAAPFVVRVPVVAQSFPLPMPCRAVEDDCKLPTLQQN